MKSWLMVVLMVVLFPALAHGEESNKKILGLEFGQTVAQVEAKGVVLKKHQEDKSGFVVYVASDIPSPVPGFELYALTFFDSLLVHVKLIGKNINNDAYGIAAKAAFDKLFVSLKKKYKVTREMMQVGAKLYKDPGEFFECLNYPGCGMWAVIMEGDGRSLILELKGNKRASGYLSLTIEGPSFDAAIAVSERRKSAVMEDAL